MAGVTLDALSRFGVTGCIQIHGPNTTIEKSNHESLTALDRERVADLNSQEPCQKFGRDLLMQRPHISLLVKDLPQDNGEKKTRIRGSMGLVLDMAMVTMTKLGVAEKASRNGKALKQIVSRTNRTIQDVEIQFRKHGEEAVDIMSSLTSILDNRAFTSKMPQEIQHVFRSMLAESKQRFDDLHAGGVAVDKGFSQIISALSRR